SEFVFCESCVCEIRCRICLGHFFSHFPTVRASMTASSSGPYSPMARRSSARLSEYRLSLPSNRNDHSFVSPNSSMIRSATASPSRRSSESSFSHRSSSCSTASLSLSRSSSTSLIGFPPPDVSNLPRLVIPRPQALLHGQPELVDDCLGGRVAGSTFAHDNVRDPVPQFVLTCHFCTPVNAKCSVVSWL